MALNLAQMMEEAYDQIWNLEWAGIPDFPYIMKYKLYEDGYMLMVSDLAAVYGEKLNEKDIQEKFHILNPFVEMLPEVILKHVKQSVENIIADELAYEEGALKITRDSNKLIIQQIFSAIGGVHFMFHFEPQMLSENQFRAHILKPALLRSLILGEEKEALQRKVEELEGRQSSTSSRSSKKENIKAICSEIKESDTTGSGVIRAFLYLQKDRITLPESLQVTTNVSPTKRINSSSANSIAQKRIRDSKNTSRNISYEEDDCEIILETQNRTQPSKGSQISIKIEHSEDDGIDSSFSNFSAKAQNEEQSNDQLSLLKREMTEEDNKEESLSKPTPYLKPSPSKRKKILKF